MLLLLLFPDILVSDPIDDDDSDDETFTDPVAVPVGEGIKVQVYGNTKGS